MRVPGSAIAVVTLVALAVTGWAAGCTSLSDDCELNLNCPPRPGDDTTSTSTSTGTGTGPSASCTGFFFSPVCDKCLQASCCQELGECAADYACINYCVFGVLPSPPECSVAPTSTRLESFGQCMSTRCPTECAPKDQCNPVTTNGCAAGGTNCELVYPGMFVCIPPFGTPVEQCGACDNLMGPFCGPGLRCYTQPGGPAGPGTCARYCCSDLDCGLEGRCELDPMLAFGAPLALAGDMVGVCVSTAPTGGAACGAPAMSPSGGACFAGFPPM